MNGFGQYLQLMYRVAYHVQYKELFEKEKKGWRAWMRRRGWRGAAEAKAHHRAHLIAEEVVNITRKKDRDNWVQTNYRLTTMVKDGAYPGLTLEDIMKHSVEGTLHDDGNEC